jgi:hypothetical protein
MDSLCIEYRCAFHPLSQMGRNQWCITHSGMETDYGIQQASLYLRYFNQARNEFLNATSLIESLQKNEPIPAYWTHLRNLATKKMGDYKRQFINFRARFK